MSAVWGPAGGEEKGSWKAVAICDGGQSDEDFFLIEFVKSAHLEINGKV